MSLSGCFAAGCRHVAGMMVRRRGGMDLGCMANFGLLFLFEHGVPNAGEMFGYIIKVLRFL